MTYELGTVEHLSQVISHVVAPAFLLGAVASFISLLFTRMTNILDRVRSLNAVAYLGFEHVWGAGILFMVSLGYLCAALIVPIILAQTPCERRSTRADVLLHSRGVSDIGAGSIVMTN
jgi:hypothetical protein